ncbi:uncharacterized protein LOC131694317 [Topomyia yanbarensis]|uniref:uncharacterized protein LOC131691818 n=1 Tax=Topomyia yanbarensis TaxID=2498891 RepID=UPI00273B42AE|nr:uncharacterized protein LOC131691818 [Topomyia yanbarensis]XP_058838942.1 uncharacterized protein LOC131694317 [Topomyia yanbarensis]
MERYLRFYIKFHGYVLAIGTILGSILMTVLLYASTDFVYPLENFYDYRFMGSAALVFGALWLGIGIALFYGIFKEVKVCLYPFAAMYMLDLFFLFIRDIVLIWHNERWYKIALLNPVTAVVVLYLTLHIMLSMVALGKLFEHDPLTPSGSNFVRFKTDDQLPVQLREEDDASLVVE